MSIIQIFGCERDRPRQAGYWRGVPVTGGHRAIPAKEGQGSWSAGTRGLQENRPEDRQKPLYASRAWMPLQTPEGCLSGASSRHTHTRRPGLRASLPPSSRGQGPTSGRTASLFLSNNNAVVPLHSVLQVPPRELLPLSVVLAPRTQPQQDTRGQTTAHAPHSPSGALPPSSRVGAARPAPAAHTVQEPGSPPRLTPRLRGLAPACPARRFLGATGSAAPSRGGPKPPGLSSVLRPRPSVSRGVSPSQSRCGVVSSGSLF